MVQVFTGNKEEVMPFEMDDRPIYSSVCTLCRHLMLNSDRSCKAFPEIKGIPDEIWMGENNHRKPFAGDHGIQFEALK